MCAVCTSVRRLVPLADGQRCARVLAYVQYAEYTLTCGAGPGIPTETNNDCTLDILMCSQPPSPPCEYGSTENSLSGWRLACQMTIREDRRIGWSSVCNTGMTNYRSRSFSGHKVKLDTKIVRVCFVCDMWEFRRVCAECLFVCSTLAKLETQTNENKQTSSRLHRCQSHCIVRLHLNIRAHHTKPPPKYVSL